MCNCEIKFQSINLNILLLGVPKRKHVTGEWRELVHNLYSSPVHVARMGQGRKVYKVLVFRCRKRVKRHVNVKKSTYVMGLNLRKQME
jgi:hypothetical protein